MSVSNKYNQGQALLIILLAMATVTTVVMSIVARSVSQVEVTNLEEESLRAFSAAEAGIEQALVVGSIGQTITDDLNVEVGAGAESTVGSFATDVRGFPDSANEFVYPVELFSGETAAIWFVTKDGNDYIDCGTQPCFSNSDLRLCWGESDSGTMTATDAEAPAVSLTFFYEDVGGDLLTTKTVYDPNSTRASSNNFELADTSPVCQIDGRDYSFHKDIDLTADLGLPITSPGRVKAMIVRLLYNSGLAQTFAVSSTGTFPPQGKLVDSVGQSGSATRRIEAYLLNPSVPAFFLSAIHSPLTITK